MRLMQSKLIWQHDDWPHLVITQANVTQSLLMARQRQGELVGKARAIGLGQTGSAVQEVLFQEVMATSAIEGENLNPAAVRSSVMRKLGFEPPTGSARSRQVDDLVDVIQDAIIGFDQPLDHDRLFRWQAALFPSGYSGLQRIAVGKYRQHTDPMQIVSGLPGKEVVHFTAPPSAQVALEMDKFLQWFSQTAPGAARGAELDGMARAAIAHVWFETIHPFEDGNGRIGRAIVDLAMAQDRGAPARLFSLSSQMLKDRKGYYEALSAAQHGSTDVSAWVQWFARALGQACVAASALLDAASEKSRFWATHSQLTLNERQRKVIQRLLDEGNGGFLGGLNVQKYIKMTGTSKPTATRDLGDLVRYGLLRVRGQGKAVRYEVAVPGRANAQL
jgi:Fic family protein